MPVAHRQRVPPSSTRARSRDHRGTQDQGSGRSHLPERPRTSSRPTTVHFGAESTSRRSKQRSVSCNANPRSSTSQTTWRRERLSELGTQTGEARNSSAGDPNSVAVSPRSMVGSLTTSKSTGSPRLEQPAAIVDALDPGHEAPRRHRHGIEQRARTPARQHSTSETALSDWPGRYDRSAYGVSHEAVEDSIWRIRPQRPTMERARPEIGLSGIEM